MQISSNMAQTNATANSKSIKNLYTEKLSSDEVKELRAQVVKNAHAFTFKSSQVQNGIFSNNEQFDKNYEEFQSFLKEISYEGKPIAELSQDEAKKLISEDGIFGIKQTSERIANFVINGANGNENLLRAGREGMLEGFKAAEKMWGEELPDISQQTMKSAVEMVDKTMYELGYSILNKEA